MLSDRIASRHVSQRPSRGHRTGSTRLIDAIAALASPAILTEHHETSWASITFAGSRHSMAWLFTGNAAVERGEVFVATLPEHEFRLPGCLVADATITEITSHQLPEPSMIVKVEILLLDET